MSGGDLEVIFVVDSKADFAYKPACLLAKSSEERPARVIVASHTRTCSQKLQNLQTGIKASSMSQSYLSSAAECLPYQAFLMPSVTRNYALYHL